MNNLQTPKNIQIFTTDGFVNYKTYMIVITDPNNLETCKINPKVLHPSIHDKQLFNTLVSFKFFPMIHI